jgi:hypothetical protein
MEGLWIVPRDTYSSRCGKGPRRIRVGGRIRRPVERLAKAVVEDHDGVS